MHVRSFPRSCRQILARSLASEFAHTLERRERFLMSARKSGMELAPSSVPRGKETSMAGQYDRNRDDEGRFTGGQRRGRQWQEDDNWGRENYGRGNYDRENYGRGVEPPRDDRGRFMSEGENGDYYGGRGYGERDDGGSRGGRGNDRYEESNYARGVGGMFGRGDYGRDETARRRAWARRVWPLQQRR
jgi:hypothetical protein